MTWQPEMDELRRRQEMTKRMGGADKVKRQHDGGRLTVDIDLKTDEKGVETSEVLLDIQPLPKKEGKSKPEPEEISTDQ